MLPQLGDNSIPTRAFLHFGLQVIIVSCQLLPLIQEKYEWSADKCNIKEYCIKNTISRSHGQIIRSQWIHGYSRNGNRYKLELLCARLKQTSMEGRVEKLCYAAGD